MPRRVKHNRSFLTPLAENFIQRISSKDSRLRRRIVRYGFWILGGMFFYSLMSGTYGLPRIARLEIQRRTLEQSNRQIRAQVADLARTKKRLLYDRDYIEYIARIRYFMVAPGETVYRYRVR